LNRYTAGNVITEIKMVNFLLRHSVVKIAVFEGVTLVWSKILGGRVIPHQLFFCVAKLDASIFLCYKNMGRNFFALSCVRQTDRQTDILLMAMPA